MSDFDRQNTWLSLQPVTGVKYTDGTTQTSAEVEGTDIKSTGEDGGSKFLREDGDGTCSWQEGVSEGTDVKSTGETGGTKFLREDGDGTCSWQATESSGAMWSSGWVDEDSEGETIAAGTAFKFTHNLGTTDVVVSVYAADDSSGAYATKVDFNYDSINTTRGAIVFDVSTNSVMIRTMVSYQAYPGEDSGSTDSGTFRSWNSKYIKVIVQAASVDATSITPEGTSVKSTTNDNEAVTKFLRADGDGTCSWQNPALDAGGAFWSSGWVNEDDDSTTIANGGTLSFAHSLGSTDVLVQIYVADDSSGTNSSAISDNTANSGASTDDLGAMVTDLSTNSIEIQLGAEGWRQLNGTGYFTFHAFTSKYIKVNVVAGGVDATTITPEGTSVKSTGEGGGSKFLREDGDGTCSWQTATDTMGSGFVLEDGDGTEVTITEGKEVKIVEGTGIDVDWTDTDNGTDGDPFDLTISCDLEGTELKSTGEDGGSKFLREDGDGTCSWQAAGSTVEYGEVNFITAVDISVYADDGNPTNDTWTSISANAAWEGANSLIVAAMTFDVDAGGNTTQELHFRAQDGSTEVEIINHSGTSGQRSVAVEQALVPVKSDGTAEFKYNEDGNGRLNYLRVVGYIDGNLATSPEGTAIKSTTNSNETSGKVLTADGDGTCSWQATTTGKVLQIVQSKQGTEDITVDANGTFAESQFEIAITPSLTSSKVLVSFTGQALGVPNTQFCWAIYADGSKILDCGWNDHSAYGNNTNLACQFLHSPSTTSEVSYKLYFASDNGGTVRCAYGSFGDVPAQYIMGMAKEIAV